MTLCKHGRKESRSTCDAHAQCRRRRRPTWSFHRLQLTSSIFPAQTPNNALYQGSSLCFVIHFPQLWSFVTVRGEWLAYHCFSTATCIADYIFDDDVGCPRRTNISSSPCLASSPQSCSPTSHLHRHCCSPAHPCIIPSSPQGITRPRTSTQCGFTFLSTRQRK